MFAQGVYPGVEYRIMRITEKNEPDTDSEEEIDIFESKPGVNYDLKPIYPLVQQLVSAADSILYYFFLIQSTVLTYRFIHAKSYLLGKRVACKNK